MTPFKLKVIIPKRDHLNELLGIGTTKAQTYISYISSINGRFSLLEILAFFQCSQILFSAKSVSFMVEFFEGFCSASN